MRFYSEGAELRADLLGAGLLLPRGVRRVVPVESRNVLTLDEAGLATARRHIAQWEAFAKRYPDRLPRFRSGLPDT